MLGRIARWLVGEPDQVPATKEQQNSEPEASPSGLDDLLFDQAEKAYSRERDENESLWRSLPVFAAAFGFAVALLGYGLSNAPLPSQRWDRIAAYLFLMLSAAGFVWAFRWFWQVARPRQFRYLSPDPEILSYGQSLRRFHSEAGASENEADARALAELKVYLAGEWSEAAAHNQKWNQMRAHARGRTAFYLMVCIALSLVANMTILISEKIDTTSGTEVKRDGLERSQESAGAP